MLGKLLVLLLLSVTWAAAEDYLWQVGQTDIIIPLNVTGGVEDGSLNVTIDDSFAYFSFYPVDATALKKEGVVYRVWQTDSTNASATLVDCTAGNGTNCLADQKAPVISYTNTIYVTLTAPKNDNFTVYFNVSTVSTRGLTDAVVDDTTNEHYLTIRPKRLFENMEWSYTVAIGDANSIIPIAASSVSLTKDSCYLAPNVSVLSASVGNVTLKDGEFNSCNMTQTAFTVTDKGKFDVVLAYKRTAVPLAYMDKAFTAQMLRTNSASTVAVSLLAVVAAVFMKFM